MSKGPEGCWASGGSMFGLGQPWVRLWPSWHTLNPPFALELLRRRTQKTHPVSSKRGISFFTRSIHYHPNWNIIFKRVFKSVTWCYSHFRFKMSEHLCGIQAKGVARVISGLWLKYHRPIFNDLKKKGGEKNPTGMPVLTENGASAGVFLAWNWLCVGVVWRAGW